MLKSIWVAVLGLLHGNAIQPTVLTKQNSKCRYCFDCVTLVENAHKPHHNRFTALFLGPPGWAGARRELLDFMVQGKINRGGHTDHPAECHSIRTNQCPPPPSPHIFYGPDGLSAAQPTASKHWRQLAHSDYGEDARVLLNGVTYTVSIQHQSTEGKMWLDFTYNCKPTYGLLCMAR